MGINLYKSDGVVLLYGLLGGYVDLNSEEVNKVVNHIINNPLELDEYFDVLFGLANKGFITIKLISYNYPNHKYRETYDKNGITYTTDKPCTDILEFIASPELRDDVVVANKLKIEVSVKQQPPIRQELEQYLNNYINGKLSTGDVKELWSYAKQRAYILWFVKYRTTHFGRTLNINLIETDRSVIDNTVLITTLFALKNEGIIDIEDIGLLSDRTFLPPPPVYIRFQMTKDIGSYVNDINAYEDVFETEWLYKKAEQSATAGNLSLKDGLIYCANIEIGLTTKERKVLALLIEESPRLVEDVSLRGVYWDWDNDNDNKKLETKTEAQLMGNIHTCINSIRRKIEDNANMVIVVTPKVGYSLKPKI